MGIKKDMKEYVKTHDSLANIWVSAQMRVKKPAKGIDRSIEKFVGNQISASEKNALRKDLKLCRFQYEMSYDEYFLFGMNHQDKKARKGFLGTHYLGTLEDKYNSKEKNRQFRDKYLCYQTYEPFYKREIIQLNDRNDETAFRGYCEKHNQIIVKPVASSKGRGIYAVDLTKDYISLEEILKEGPVVLEERIRQVEEIGAFHPDSVNSIRVLTILTKEGPEILFTILRMGCGGSVIDNASSGGVVAEVDLETGVTCTDGYRENGEVYTKHPDTGKVIKGNHIPYWDELKQVVKEVAVIEKDVKIAGWDFALTDRGWVMIEGNDRPAFTAVQMCRKSGIRARAEELMEKI